MSENAYYKSKYNNAKSEGNDSIYLARNKIRRFKFIPEFRVFFFPIVSPLPSPWHRDISIKI